MIAEITRKVARKLTAQDLQAVADCVATMKLTTTEACLHLGIKPKQFNLWANRRKHNESFESIIARTRANSIAGLVKKIQNAGDDQEIILPNGKVVNKRGDWRAPAFLLQNVIASDCFYPQVSTTPQVSTNVNIQVMHDTLKRIIDAEVVSTNETRQIEAPRVKMPVRSK